MPDDLYRLPFSASPEAPRRCHSEFWYRRRRAHRIETRRTPCDAGSGAAAHHGRILVGPASLPDSLAAGGTPALLNQASFLGAEPERSDGDCEESRTVLHVANGRSDRFKIRGNRTDLAVRVVLRGWCVEGFKTDRPSRRSSVRAQQSGGGRNATLKESAY